jgi:dihydrolipoamide dehydrogenase
VASVITVRVPDIGDFEDVDVIEVHVTAGDRVAVEDPLITLESDKATMDIPAPRAGVVEEVLVAVDQQVSQGTPILTLEVAEEDAAASEATEAVPREQPAPRPEPAVAAPEPAAARASTPRARPQADQHAEVLVLGSGPGGYTAAFRAADLGKQVVLVERYPVLGGVCLNVGCIPSKALLHMAEVIREVGEIAERGVEFGPPKLDFERIRAHKDAVVAQLTGGLAKLAKQRKVEVVTGTGTFQGPQLLAVEGEAGRRTVSFDHAIIAAGSRSIELPGFPNDDPRIMGSTEALEIDGGARRLLVVGGGVIGLEMASVYEAMGSEVTVVEMLPALIPGADPDLVRPLQRRMQRRVRFLLETKVKHVAPLDDGLRVHFDGKTATDPEIFDRILVAVGRRANGDRIGAERAGVAHDSGVIPVDAQLRTNVPHIHAIGDVTGPPQLAHRATHQGKTAAEVIAGLPAAFDARSVPSVAYTDPEVAWTGLTESEAKAQGIAVDKASFPWAASGRALGIARSEGTTKLLFSKETGRLVGAGIVGRNAGELIAETTLALEMGADAEDIGLTIHPHPTLSETVAFAAETAAGTITDLYVPRGRRKRQAVSSGSTREEERS